MSKDKLTKKMIDFQEEHHKYPTEPTLKDRLQFGIEQFGLYIDI